jgi:hypothetical protein
VIPLNKLTGRFKSEHPLNTRECFRLTDFWATLYLTEYIKYGTESIYYTLSDEINFGSYEANVTNKCKGKIVPALN